MATAEQMARSIQIEGEGIFALLWDAKEDLLRALLVLQAALSEIPMRPLLLAPGKESARALQALIETRVIIEASSPLSEAGSTTGPIAELWILFLQQASYQTLGPLLNGWRGPLAQSPGTLLVIRHADFEPFQRWAPDLASFIGPRVFHASTMLSLVTSQTHQRLKINLPETWTKILSDLPGTVPPEDEMSAWIAACSSAAD